MTQYALDAAGLTDQGVKRDHNEDAWSAPPPDLTAEQTANKGLLYIVADGVGGHQAGDVASAMAVEIIQRRYYADPSPDVAASLRAAIRAAHQAISLEAADKPGRYGMGSTVTAAVLRGGDLTVANVGDSRTYLIRAGQARQVTTDHSWVEEQVRIGLITREEAAKHPQRNIITRSLGGGPELEVDLFEERVVPGDSVLLCSDGLSNMIPGPEIGDIVSQGRKARATIQVLIELAKQRGAPDNVTAIVLNIRPSRGGLRRLLVTVGIMGGWILVIGMLVLLMLDKSKNKVEPISPLPTLEPTAPSMSPLPTPEPSTSTAPLLPDAPTATLLPLDAAIPRPELVWPEQDASLVAGDMATFSWKWEQKLEGEEWRFVFVLRPDQDAPALIDKELPLNQRGLELAQLLAPGEYWWAVSVVGADRRGEPVERRLVVIEPTPTPNQ
jgi:serine/threonine protein phosphatase PrpC